MLDACPRSSGCTIGAGSRPSKYCRKSGSGRRAYQLIDAADTVNQLPEKTATIVATESQARELAKVPPEHREAVIEKAVEKGKVTAKTIRDNRLYRITHRTFEAYCKGKWKMTPQYANRLVAAASSVKNLETIVSKPTRESQVRPLTKLEPEQQKQAWEHRLACR